MDRIEDVVRALMLNGPERALYERHLRNLYGPGGVDNPDGSRSTLYQMSAGVGNKVYNLPTVHDGRILDPDAAFAQAQKEGLNNFPSYGSQEEAEQRYNQMHDYMDQDASNYFKNRFDE